MKHLGIIRDQLVDDLKEDELDSNTNDYYMDNYRIQRCILKRYIKLVDRLITTELDVVLSKERLEDSNETSKS